MLVRAAALVLSAVSAATAWPIFFYTTPDCNHYPVFTLDYPPGPNACRSFGHHADILSYSGGTSDDVQKLLLYESSRVCHYDQAHHAYANHTINNSTNLCVNLQPYGVPRAYTFIEEFLGPIPADYSYPDSESLRVQN